MPPTELPLGCYKSWITELKMKGDYLSIQFRPQDSYFEQEALPQSGFIVKCDIYKIL